MVGAFVSGEGEIAGMGVAGAKVTGDVVTGTEVGGDVVAGYGLPSPGRTMTEGVAGAKLDCLRFPLLFFGLEELLLGAGESVAIGAMSLHSPFLPLFGFFLPPLPSYSSLSLLSSSLSSLLF